MSSKPLSKQYLREGLNVESQFLCLQASRQPGAQINRQLIAWLVSTALKQRIDLLFTSTIGSKAILEAVVEENVSKAGADGAKAVLIECPRRACSRLSRNQSSACQQNRGTL